MPATATVRLNCEDVSCGAVSTCVCTRTNPETSPVVAFTACADVGTVAPASVWGPTGNEKATDAVASATPVTRPR